MVNMKSRSKLDRYENEAYERRYYCLKRQCETLEQRNERLLHRLHSVGKILHQYKKERKYLMMRLDQHGDSYRETNAALPYESQEGNQSLELLTHRRSKPAATDGGVSVSKKKAKVDTRDPNAPKKPVNAYVMFFQHKRHSVQEQYFKQHNVDIGNHELTRIVGQQWNNLSADEKRVFYNLYEKDKERYQKELTVYETNRDSETSKPPLSANAVGQDSEPTNS